MFGRLLRGRGAAADDGSTVAAVGRVYAEAARRNGEFGWRDGFAAKTPTGKALLEWSPSKLIELAHEALALAGVIDETSEGEERAFRLRMTARDVTAAVLGRELPFTTVDFLRLLDELGPQMRDSQERAGYLPVAMYHPVVPLIGALERHCGVQPAPDAMHARLHEIAAVLVKDGTGDALKALRRVDVLLGDGRASDVLPRSSDPWTQAVIAARDELDGAGQALADRLLTLAGAGIATKPGVAFGKRCDKLIGGAGAVAVGRVAAALLTAAAEVKGTRESGRVPVELGGRLRGLAWIAGRAGGEDATRALGRLAFVAWQRVPGHGVLCQKAANAAIGALGDLPEGAPQLGRLRAQLKQPAALQVIDTAIGAAADRLGIPLVEFEERVVPTFDLDRHGRRTDTLGEYTAELRLAPDGSCARTFTSSAGKTVKSVPPVLKDGHAAELAALKQTAKDIELLAGAQKLRLERLLRDERTWTHGTWQARYLDHGLLGVLARALIWTIDGRSVTWADGRLVDHAGTPLQTPADTATVRLWHPVDARAEEVGAWRRFVEERRVAQPFKQAHREVCLLTPDGSDRFAAHTLRQHQLAALARGRGWDYALQGTWEGADERAVLELPQHDLQVAFELQPPRDEWDVSEGGVLNHVVSGPVRFTRAGQAVSPAAIPARVLSEVLRDVDLFVGVTSIANDPT